MTALSAPVLSGLLVALPLAGAIACFLRGGGFAAVVGTAVPAAMLGCAALLAAAVWSGGPAVVEIAGWSPPLGIAWRADGMACLFLLTTATVATAVAVHAHPELRHEGGKLLEDHFWPQMLLLLAALNALFLSRDVFNLYVTLELATLAAVGLVLVEGSARVLAAGLRYMLMAMFGSLSYLLGVALLYGAFGTLDMAGLAAVVDHGWPATAALALMTAGLMVKGAAFPLHGWLPPAHGSAPAPVSALLSGLVVKGALYVLLRLWTEVFAPSPAAGQLLGACGAGAILWGSAMALRQRRLKLLLAYSTVAQLGYLLLAIPLAPAGAVYFAVNHALAKGAMFLAAGTVMMSLGHDRLDGMQGAARIRPMTAFTLALGGVTLMGLPPSGGFIAKWLLIEAAIRAGQWWWVAAILGGSLLAAGYVFRVLAGIVARRADLAPPFATVPRRIEIAALGLALVSTALGLAAAAPLALLRAGAAP